MNPLEYLILGFLIVMVIGTWGLIDAIRRAEVGFENADGFQVGIPSPMQSFYPASTYVPVAPARAVLPEAGPQKSPRRHQRSKPPMLPVNLEVSDLNPSTERKPRRPRKTTSPKPSVAQELQPPKPGPAAP